MIQPKLLSYRLSGSFGTVPCCGRDGWRAWAKGRVMFLGQPSVDG